SLYAPDQPGEQGSRQPMVTWTYHVAPVLHVRDTSGRVIEMVLDPSTSSGPIRLSQWLEDLARPKGGGAGSQGQILEVTPAEAIRQKGFAKETGKVFYWKTDPRVALPPGPGFPESEREAAQRPEVWQEELELRAEEVPIFKMAAEI